MTDDMPGSVAPVNADQAAAEPGAAVSAHETRRARLWRLAESKHVPLRAIVTTIVLVAVAYLLAKALYRLRDVLLIMVVAGFIALLLNPLVVLLQKSLRRRGLAVTVVTLLAIAAFAGLAFAFGYPLVNGLTHLATSLPEDVSKAEHGKNWVGSIVTRYHLQNWVQKNSPKLVVYAKDLAHPALSVGEGALSLVFELFEIFVLVVLLMLEGPKMRRGLLGLMAPDRATRYSAVARDVNREVTGYMLGNFATSVIAGVVVFVTLLSLGVQFPFLWALWVALVDFLPMIGGALAGIPVVLFAFTHGFTAGLVTAIVFVVYTQVENHVLNPIVMSRTVRINPLLVLVAILVGAEIGSWVGGLFGGFVAALLSIPAAGAMQVILRAIWVQTDPDPPAHAGTGPAGAGGAVGSEIIVTTVTAAAITTSAAITVDPEPLAD